MQTTAAETMVGAPPAEVYPAILALIAATWCACEDAVVHAQPPHRLVHSVSLDDEIACWLTWELTPSPMGETHVRLVHDELASLPAPAPDLNTVLRLLRDGVSVKEQS